MDGRGRGGQTVESRIDAVEVRVFETVSWAEPDVDGHVHPGPERTAAAALFTVRDADGIEGHCLCSAEALRPFVLNGFVRGVLVGEDAFMRERIWGRLYRMQRGSGGQLTDQAIGYVDQALWDLAGRKLAMPVWKLLGGARAKVPAYASTMCGDCIEGGLATPEDYGRFAKTLLGLGYQAIKLHTWMPPVPGAPDVDLDAQACAAVREAAGPKVPLMLDANHWYGRAQALWLGRALEQLGYYWYEEPMEEASISSYRWLADQLDILVIGPESAAGKAHTRAEWALAGASDILRVGVGDVAGITPAMRVIHLAEAHNLDVEVHGNGSGNLAILGATESGRWYERGLLHPHYDYDRLLPHLRAAVDPINEHGEVAMPDRPGLGDDLDFDYIEDHILWHF
jgi:L-alanine-DL-glutamate epimerase-like enolase superfamily enzyme